MGRAIFSYLVPCIGDPNTTFLFAPLAYSNLGTTTVASLFPANLRLQHGPGGCAMWFPLSGEPWIAMVM